jgi:hypothetical protein
MCSDELHPDDSHLILHFDDEPVLVAAYVEHDAVVTADARTRELVFDVLRPAPCATSPSEPPRTSCGAGFSHQRNRVVPRTSSGCSWRSPSSTDSISHFGRSIQGRIIQEFLPALAPFAGLCIDREPWQDQTGRPCHSHSIVSGTYK